MVMMEEGNSDNSNLEKLLLDLAFYPATIESLGAASSRAERDAVFRIKENLTDTSNLYSETLTLYTQHSKIAPLVEALVALVVEVPTAGVLTSDIKTEIADSVTRAAQEQRSFDQSDGFSLFAIN